MKKQYLKYILFFVLLLILYFPNKAFAVDYIISSYDIDMVVNEDNTFDITERITAFFNVPKHRNI